MISDPHILPPVRLLDQLRQVLRYKHYSLRTEQAYLYWVRFFVRWHGRDGTGGCNTRALWGPRACVTF
jgi:hypothetical protein